MIDACRYLNDYINFFFVSFQVCKLIDQNMIDTFKNHQNIM